MGRQERESGGRRRFLCIGGLLVLAPLLARTPARAQAGERVIAVVAKKFVFVPDEIRVAHGETVVLHLDAPEVPMGFKLADLGLRTDLMPGQPALLRLPLLPPGRYAFLCDVFCGSGHEDMSGLLVVA